MVSGVVANVAVTVVFALRVSVQLGAVPEHPPPLQPAKRPLDNETSKVMLEAAGKFAEHVGSQLMPAGVLDTVPDPVPVCILFTASVNVPLPPDVLNVAVTVVFEFNVSVQLPVPEQPPLQPANEEPEDGVAIKVTTVPEENDLEQLEPQLMPEGLLVTVPVPVPDLFTWSCLPPRANAGVSFTDMVVGTSTPVPQADANINGTIIPEHRHFLINVSSSFVCCEP